MSDSTVEHRGTIVIGSGPGGYVAAIRASELGQKVTLIEATDRVGGICLNEGCVPSKALISVGHRIRAAHDTDQYGLSFEAPKLDFAKTQHWKQHDVVERMTRGVRGLLKKHDVEIVQGFATLDSDTVLRVMPAGPQQFMSVDLGRQFTFDDLIIATGSRPIEIPSFPWGDRVIDSTGALNLPEVPKRMIVIGGGYIGTELAGAYADMGAKVIILEGSPSILPLFESDLSSIVTKRLEAKGVEIHTGVRARDVDEDADGVQVFVTLNDEEETLEADYCLVTIGRRPNTDNIGLEFTSVEIDNHGLVVTDEQGRTASPHIYAIGDITAGPALAHKAFFQAKTAAGAIAGQPTANDYIGVPAVCFSDPEVATVGVTKDEAEKQGVAVETAKFPFAGNARAVSLGEPDGFVRLVSTKDEGTLIGAQIVGPGASDLISELSLAVNAQMNVEDIALTIHPHPTLSEPIAEAADIAIGYPTHI